MWNLSSIEGESCFRLLCDSSSIVSRDGPGQIILHDKTVSKVHASFFVTYQDKFIGSSGILPDIILCDLKSTNGTYVCSGSSDYKKLVPNEPVTLKQEDLIKFGRNKIFRLKYKPFIITSSQITGREEKEQLKNCIKCLGGHLVKEWIPSCSLLVMNDLVVTTKTVCALGAGANIVTPSYLIDKITAIKEKKPLPDIKNYLPILKEPSIKSTEVSFHPNPSRKKLFLGKNFYFQNDASLKKMKQSVTGAGGTTVLLSESNYQKILDSNSIFIKAVAEKNEVPSYVSNCYELLKNKGLHPIPESDIGLAVIYNSTDKYCNPKFRTSGILQPNTNQSQLSSLKLEVYATETQHETESIPCVLPSRTTIPETGRSSLKSNSSITKSVEQQQNADIDGGNIVEMNKENLGRTKRSIAESNSPNEKVIESKSKRINLSRVLPETCEMTVDDEIDNTCQFQPTQFSTEKSLPDKSRTYDFAIPQSTAIRKNVRISAPQKVATETYEESFEISCNPKSIPFEPYTLPSINPVDMEVEESFQAEENIENEDDKETQIFSGVIKDVKKEPVSQDHPRQVEEIPQINVKKNERVESPTGCLKRPDPIQIVNETLTKEGNDFAVTFSGRKRKGRLSSAEIGQENGWIKAVPSKPTAEKNVENERVESPSDCFKRPDPIRIVNETQTKEGNDFAVTFSGRKRKGRLSSAEIIQENSWIKAVPSKPASENNIENERVESSSDCFKKPDPNRIVNETQTKEGNDFAITFSSGRKRKGRLSFAEVNPQTSNPGVDSNLACKRLKVEEQEPLSKSFKPPVARTIKKSPSVVEAEMLLNERKSSPTDRKLKGEIEETPFLSTQKMIKDVKMEKDISDLSETLERSYMIVEVVDNLIVKRTEPEESFSTDVSNGLPNFKAFVKVWHNTGSETSLPRIIGGSDLVSTSDCFRRESFLASQPPLPEHLARREQEVAEFRQQLQSGGESSNIIGPNRKIDSDFLPPTRSGRRKGRL